jgi:hypothetical protein
VWNDIDGMVHLRGAFDPERGSILLSRLEQRVEAMFHSGDRELPVEVGPGVEPNDHRRALALLASVSGTSPNRERSSFACRPAGCSRLSTAWRRGVQHSWSMWVGATQLSRSETPAVRLVSEPGEFGSATFRRPAASVGW